MNTFVKIGQHTIALTHTDKILLPPSISKGDIIDYYINIGDKMVPYMKNHPLMMHRFPNGLAGESFYQKDASDYFPLWIKRQKIEKVGGFTHYVVCQNKATLIYLANQACITPHLWLSRISNLDFPDRLIFDLDPSSDNFNDVRLIALTLKKLFDELNLDCFVMTTGSKGLHVTVPLDKKLDFKAVRAFAVACALHIKEVLPKKVTLEIRKEKRGNMVFIDTLRNQFGATAVAPYAIRARPGGPVATPLHWDEVEERTLTSQKYTLHTLFKRLETIDDPWHNFLSLAQSLKKAQKTLGIDTSEGGSPELKNLKKS